jgi:pimeloyl-ACP methyl ester carboxylesterase
MTNTIMIFLPGTTGSTLVMNKNNYKNALDPVWPVQVLAAALIKKDYASALALLKKRDLYPGVPRRAPNPSHGYTGFFNHFTSQGFQYFDYSNPAGLPKLPPKNLLLGLAYDWRQDNSTSARYLQGALQTIDSAYKATGDYQVFLVGHSMGGLVSRAYLEDATFAKDPWRSNIKALITLGTPHLGAPTAVVAIQGQMSTVFSDLKPEFDTVIESFVNRSFSDSTYELLPPPSMPFIQDGANSYSVFDPNLPAAVKASINGLSPTDLKAAEDFFARLTNTSNLPPYYCIYGLSALESTIVGFEYNAKSGVLTQQPSLEGDHIVPASSASFAGRTVAGRYNPPGDVTHLQLPGDPNVQQQVAQWMGLSMAAVRTAA